MMLSYVPMSQLAKDNPLLLTANAAETAQTGTCGDNLTWTFNADTGELVISGTGDMNNWNSPFFSPWYNYIQAIKSVTVENGVTSIGANAFSFHVFLTSVTIPASVTEIEKNAFERCISLKSVEIPDNVKNIGAGAFKDCGLTGIDIPDSVSNIGDGAFQGCKELSNAVISASVTSIGEGAFGDCPALVGITVASVNAAYSSNEDGVLFNKNKTELIQYPAGNTGTSYEIPESVTSISNGAFGGCTFLADVTISKSVISIGSGAFAGYTTSIANITVDSANEIYSSDEYGVLFNKDKTELIQYPAGNTRTSYEIPAGVTSSAGSFYRCTYLTSITIPAGTTSIEPNTFYGCASLTSIAIPDTVTSIGIGAFSECVSLKNVTIPACVTSIGNYAFFTCPALTSVTIPAGVTSIGVGAFADTPNLNGITVDSANPAYSSDEHGILFNKEKTELIQYPGGNQKTGYKIPDGVTSIGYGAFYSFSFLEYVHMHANVTAIGEHNFVDTSAYICSTTEDCYAKTYAENNGIEFKVCTGHEGEDFESKSGIDYATNIIYSYENGCFDCDGEVDFEVVPKSKDEYADAFRGYADEIDDIFFYDINFYAVDENQNRIGEIQPTEGKKVKIGFPIPDGYETVSPKLFMVIHKRSDNGKLEFFIPENDNIEITDGYVYIWTDNFSPFALAVNYKGSEKNVSSISITSAPSKTSYTYKNSNLDLSGLALTVTYSDGTTETVTDTSEVKAMGFDNSKTGSQTVTVEYGGATTKFDVTVSYAWWQWIIRILLLGFLWY